MCKKLLVNKLLNAAMEAPELQALMYLLSMTDSSHGDNYGRRIKEALMTSARFRLSAAAISQRRQQMTIPNLFKTDMAWLIIKMYLQDNLFNPYLPDASRYGVIPRSTPQDVRKAEEDKMEPGMRTRVFVAALDNRFDQILLAASATIEASTPVLCHCVDSADLEEAFLGHRREMEKISLFRRKNIIQAGNCSVYRFEPQLPAGSLLPLDYNKQRNKAHQFIDTRKYRLLIKMEKISNEGSANLKKLINRAWSKIRHLSIVKYDIIRKKIADRGIDFHGDWTGLCRLIEIYRPHDGVAIFAEELTEVLQLPDYKTVPDRLTAAVIRRCTAQRIANPDGDLDFFPAFSGRGFGGPLWVYRFLCPSDRSSPHALSSFSKYLFGSKHPDDDARRVLHQVRQRLWAAADAQHLPPDPPNGRRRAMVVAADAQDNRDANMPVDQENRGHEDGRMQIPSDVVEAEWQSALRVYREQGVFLPSISENELKGAGNGLATELSQSGRPEAPGSHGYVVRGYDLWPRVELVGVPGGRTPPSWSPQECLGGLAVLRHLFLPELAAGTPPADDIRVLLIRFNRYDPALPSADGFDPLWLKADTEVSGLKSARGHAAIGQASKQAGPCDPRERPLRQAMRLLLEQVFRTDAELDAFCVDYFQSLPLAFAAGMDRTTKVNLLLEQPVLRLLDRLVDVGMVAKQTMFRWLAQVTKLYLHQFLKTSLGDARTVDSKPTSPTYSRLWSPGLVVNCDLLGDARTCDTLLSTSASSEECLRAAGGNGSDFERYSPLSWRAGVAVTDEQHADTQCLVFAQQRIRLNLENRPVVSAGRYPGCSDGSYVALAGAQCQHGEAPRRIQNCTTGSKCSQVSWVQFDGTTGVIDSGNRFCRTIESPRRGTPQQFMLEHVSGTLGCKLRSNTPLQCPPKENARPHVAWGVLAGNVLREELVAWVLVTEQSPRQLGGVRLQRSCFAASGRHRHLSSGRRDTIMADEACGEPIGM